MRILTKWGENEISKKKNRDHVFCITTSFTCAEIVKNDSTKNEFRDVRMVKVKVAIVCIFNEMQPT